MLAAAPAFTETTLRIATFATELERDGPGLLLRDIRKGKDPQVIAVARVVADAQPDILVLQGIDFDHNNQALKALRDVIEVHGWEMAHVFAAMPNSGVSTRVDMDGDGRRGQPRDAQGYGEFLGQGGMAILSRHPIRYDTVQDFSQLLWRDIPNASLPITEAGPFPSQDALEIQRLSSVSHWVIPILVEERVLNIMTFHATAPVFDGPEDRNGHRNHDEIVFWLRYLDGAMGDIPTGSFVLAGNANLDPVDGEGRKSAINMLLADPRFQDPAPARAGDPEQGVGHQGDPKLDTAAWPEPIPGHLRVSYVLPSRDLSVRGSGVFWPNSGPMAETVSVASRHRLIWVDLDF